MNQRGKSSKPPIEISPGRGVGPVQFGFSPREVRAVWREPHVWEPWMGGNRNDSLLYPGIIIGFDQCDAFGPLENSRVVEFSIHKTFAQLYFLGLDVFLIHTGELERKLIEDGVPFEMDEGYLAIPSMGLEFVTGLDDTIDEVNFWKLMHP